MTNPKIPIWEALMDAARVVEFGAKDTHCELSKDGYQRLEQELEGYCRKDGDAILLQLGPFIIPVVTSSDVPHGQAYVFDSQSKLAATFSLDDEASKKFWV